MESAGVARADIREKIRITSCTPFIPSALLQAGCIEGRSYTIASSYHDLDSLECKVESYGAQ